MCYGRLPSPGVCFISHLSAASYFSLSLSKSECVARLRARALNAYYPLISNGAENVKTPERVVNITPHARDAHS